MGELFLNLFQGHPQYSCIRSRLLAEMSNHKEGQTNTFQDYQRNRQALFERANDSLQNDVRSSVSVEVARYMTVPIETPDEWIICQCEY